MPLVNSPTLTSRKLPANRARAQLSRGLTTREGPIGMRGANISPAFLASLEEGGAQAQDMGASRFCCPTRPSQPGPVDRPTQKKF